MSQGSSQIRVFVVDDEEVIASTFAMILRTQGFDASSFSHPQEALQAACSGAPDLLVSDVVMPEFSGVELAIRIKQRYPNCKVLLFSGQAVTADLLSAARAKGHNFELLSKPIHPVNFLRSIRTTMGVDS